MNKLEEWKNQLECAEDYELFFDSHEVKEMIDVIENQQKLLDSIVYHNEIGEPKITTKELAILLTDFKILQDENEKLKNRDMDKLEQRIEELELFINDFIELSQKQKELVENARQLLEEK